MCQKCSCKHNTNQTFKSVQLCEEDILNIKGAIDTLADLDFDKYLLSLITLQAIVDAYERQTREI